MLSYRHVDPSPSDFNREQIELWEKAKQRLRGAVATEFPTCNTRFVDIAPDHILFRIETADGVYLTPRFRPTSPQTVQSLDDRQLRLWLHYLCEGRAAEASLYQETRCASKAREVGK